MSNNKKAFQSMNTLSSEKPEGKVDLNFFPFQLFRFFPFLFDYLGVENAVTADV